MSDERIKVLLVEDNKDFSKLLQAYLQRYEKDKFSVVWKENYTDAIAELESNKDIDVILMDYFLPGKNGLEITKEIFQRKIDRPIIFLTVNKDFDVVLRVMKLGVADYLIKEEVSTPVLPKTILNVIEKHRLKERLMQLEISKHRVSVMKEMISGVVDDLEHPLVEMREIVDTLQGKFETDAHKNYVRIIDENVHRIMDRLQKLKVLKDDKTVQYIKDIRMIDLS